MHINKFFDTQLLVLHKAEHLIQLETQMSTLVTNLIIQKAFVLVLRNTKRKKKQSLSQSSESSL